MSEGVMSSRAPEPVGAYPHAKRAGDLLFLSGVGPRRRGSKEIPGVTLDAHGTVVAKDIEMQCRSCFDNLRAVVEDAGANWLNVVDVTVFLTSMKEDFPTYNRVWSEYFGGPGKPSPARTTIEIGALPTPIAVEAKATVWSPRDAVLIDISPMVSSTLAVFPGDTAFSREVLMDMMKGDAITLSTIRSTVHLGAHADAPSHYLRDGRTIEQQPLDLYVGPCEVMRVTVGAKTERLVGVADLPAVPTQPRVLLVTGSHGDPDCWSGDFAGLDPDLVDYLHAQGVRLVGIDTPSVDRADSKTLSAHARFAANDMAIMEGLVLSGVADGLYELIAPPLRIAGADASPVRALLRRPY
ncbi:MAG: hypothetical protein EXS00_07005 [Phycisphaerales bacterium]|nr:hypothetical protein [Phycisphaerales bacterium]